MRHLLFKYRPNTWLTSARQSYGTRTPHGHASPS
jgi:hypothetical protein